MRTFEVVLCGTYFHQALAGDVVDEVELLVVPGPAKLRAHMSGIAYGKAGQPIGGVRAILRRRKARTTQSRNNDPAFVLVEVHDYLVCALLDSVSRIQW